MKRRNILLIHSDQHRYDSLGANGHAVVRTPHLDRLAREGVNFSHAFTPTPICTPARACLMTGAWPTTHGSFGIPTSEVNRAARRELPVLTRLLCDAGYQVRMVGKFHGELEGRLVDHGVEEFVPYWDYRKRRETQGLPAWSPQHSLFGGVDPVPADKSALAWQADIALHMLDAMAGRPQPFFQRWDPPEPHLPCNPPKEYADLYPPETIQPWPSWPDPLTNKPPAQRRQLGIWGIENWPWEKWAPVVARYFAIITEMDAHIGRLLDRLGQLGRLDDTLVIYTTDHGDFCGGHGMMDKHFSMYDDILRVPLLMRWPGRLPAGLACDGFVSHELDIARTLLEIAGIEPPATFCGHDLVTLANGRLASRPDIFAQYFGTESGLYSQRMVRDRRFKYVFNPTAFDEFYDLAADPGEITNRIDDPASRDEIARLRRRMADWMREVRDPLLNNWTRPHLLGEPNIAARSGLC